MSNEHSTNLFDSRLFTWRAVLPPMLRREDRARLIARLSAAVRQQSTLADQCEAVLRTSGRIEECGEYILLEHEPAAALAEASPGRPRVRLDAETLLWLGASGGLALAEAQRAGVAHGGVMPAGFHQDRIGLAQLGDFGIAAALESVCGTDRRREIFLDPTPREIDGRWVSGCWTLLHERERREFGWIAPFFAHELLDGRVRLNPRGDRFALGVVLHYLATGRHPYHIDFSDPTLRLYYTLEPPPLEHERPDWRDALTNGGGKGAERGLREWCQFEQRLCASEASLRGTEPDALEQSCAAIAPEAWRAAAKTLRAGLRGLDSGGPARLLEAASNVTGAALPRAWRARLDGLIREVERTRSELDARSAVKRDLDAAQTAIDEMDLSGALRLARSVANSPLAESDQRKAAAAVLERCAELQQSVESGADQFARTYLETAAEALGRGDADEARQTLEFVIADPGTPAPRAAQARQLMADVEALAAVYERHDAELAAAERDRSAGDFDAAKARLDALSAEPKLRAAVATAATALRSKVAALQALRQGYAERLDVAQKAWDRADVDALREALKAVPEDFSDPTINELRTDLRGRARTLTAALQTRASAVAAAGKGEIEAALRHATRISPHAVLPRAFRDELNEQVRAWTGRLEEQRREAVARASAALDAAEAEYLAGAEREAVRRIESAVLSEIALPLEARDRAERLLERCRRALDARQRLAEANAALESRDLESAGRIAAEFDLAEMTPRLLQDVESFDQRLEKAHAARLEEERAEWRRRAESIAAQLDAGRLDEGESALTAESPRPEHGPELANRWQRLSDELAAGRALATRLDVAAKRLHQSADGPALCTAELDKIPAGAASWAKARSAALRGEAAAIVAEQERARAELAAARQAEIDDALDALDADVTRLSRQNRRVRGGILEWSRAADLSAAQLARAAALLKRHDELPLRARIPWPLVSAVGLVALVAGGGIWWWVASSADTPDVVVPVDPESTQPATTQATPVNPTTEPSTTLVKNDKPKATSPDDTPEKTDSPKPVEPPPAAGPSPQEIAAYRDALLAELPEQSSVELVSSNETTYRVRASWNGAKLLASGDFSWDVAAKSFDPPPASVAPRFARQIAALSAIADEKAAIQLDETYDARIRWRTPVAKVEIRSIGDAGVELRGSAAIEGDSRPEPEFPLTCTANGAQFVADAASKTAFANNLGALQAFELERFTAPDWPSGFKFAPPTSAIDGVATFGVVNEAGARVGALKTSWDAEKLKFVADDKSLAAARTAALMSTLRDVATLDRLKAAWLGDLRTPLAAAVKIGSEHLTRCAIASIVSSEGEATAVKVRAAPADAAAEEAIEFTVPLIPVEGRLDWPPATHEILIRNVGAALQVRNDDSALRAKRREAAIAAVAKEAGVDVGAVGTGAGETWDEFSAAAGTPDVTRYLLRWNTAAFRYDIAEKKPPLRIEPPVPPVTPPQTGIEARLHERLGTESSIDLEPSEFGALYADVVRKKTERFGATEYQLHPALVNAAGASTAPLEIAKATQRLTAPNAAADRYPVVFVEYFVGEQDVYALGGRGRTGGANDFTSVDSRRLWKVISTAELTAASDAASIRRLFENPSRGERLLGVAFGTAIEGSQGDTGSFGLAVAPDGPLWLVRWDLVKFDVRPVSNIAKLNAADTPASASRLRDLLSYQTVNRAQEFRRVGIWCFPSLGGKRTGASPPKLTIGLADPNEQLKFTVGGRGRSLVYARIEDAAVGDDPNWAGFAGQLTPTSIGYLFWNYGWTGPVNWVPTKTTSVALILQ